MRRNCFHFISACALALLPAFAGCGGESCPSPDGAGYSVVLTFDDGPIAADIPEPQGISADELLSSLRHILRELDARQLRAVFFIKGPGREELDTLLLPAFKAGILEIYNAGHVLGYHGYNHDPGIWATLSNTDAARLRAAQDLDKLELFIDRVLDGTGLTRDVVFAPIFRQPYGGGLDRSLGQEVAADRGWIYRGFAIDSFDWLVNADVDPLLLPR